MPSQRFLLLSVALIVSLIAAILLVDAAADDKLKVCAVFFLCLHHVSENSQTCESVFDMAQLEDDCCLNGNCCHGLEYCCNECDGTCTCSVHGKCSHMSTAAPAPTSASNNSTATVATPARGTVQLV